MSRTRRRLRALLVGLALAALLFETVPRVVPVPGLAFADLQPVRAHLAHSRMQAHPYLAYVNKPGFRTPPGVVPQVSHNAQGLRGPEIELSKPPGTFRVVCLGGSSTYGHGPSSDATTWPAQLEALLAEARPGRAVQVLNGGASGYSTFESIGNYAFRLKDYRPDLVVVYHAINDARCAVYRGPVRPDNTHWRAVWLREPPCPLERSLLWLAWRRYLTDWSDDVRNVARYGIVGFDASADPYSLRPDSEVGFRSTYRNLNTLVSLVRAEGARVLLAKQGMREADVLPAGSGREQLEAFHTVVGIVERVAGERGCLLADPAAALEEARRVQAAESGSDGIFTHEVHVTDGGARLIAESVARTILDAGLLD